MNASAKQFLLLVVCCVAMTVALAMPQQSDSAQLFREVRQVPRALGASQCAWGPSYWCSSPQATVECNAHAYCSTHMMINWP
ncbi:hypothetical protein TSAR_000574 [Trichomalopsis sarcophagae]|uniref:Saposin A-type domain-containing protein n=1 Tax=Trichomalopsis sarcophagae TaxID=543379 RepID=A0A232F3X1_9HYME|nr:hypothetical protein TSAR_000574 [Trichomalopsis sarcophagae]